MPTSTLQPSPRPPRRRTSPRDRPADPGWSIRSAAVTAGLGLLLMVVLALWLVVAGRRLDEDDVIGASA